MNKIRIFTTGGTIDKVYFDATSTYEVGKPEIARALRDILLSVDIEITPVLRKDSLDINTRDRDKLYQRVLAAPESKIIITHGTDTMIETATSLRGIECKTIVLTGALQPAVFKTSDALFNIGCAFAAAQCASPGVYVAMNGRVFRSDKVRKNRQLHRFVDNC